MLAAVRYREGGKPGSHLSSIPHVVFTKIDREQSMTSKKNAAPLFAGCSWSFDLLGKSHDAISKIALDELELDIYPNPIEIISA